MALSSQRAVALSVLGLALVGLAVDRLVLSDDAAPAVADNLLIEPAATTVAPAQGSGGASPPAVSDVPKEQARMAELARSLRELGVENGFLAALPESFDVAQPRPEAPVAVAPTSVPIGEPPAVTAILTGARPKVIAAGKSVGVGSQVDGWRVVAVREGRVTFERDGQQADRIVRRPTLESIASGESVR